MPFTGPQLSGPAPLHDLLSGALSDKPDDIALVAGANAWTWRELDHAVDNLAAHFVDMGLEPGEHVASLMPNCGELLIHYLACLKAGLVSLPLNYRYTPPEIDYALQTGGASLLFAHAERASDIEASKEAGTLEKGLISLGGQIDESRQFEELITSGPADAPLPNPDDNRLSLIFFTSGSTGKPKGVMHSHASFGSIAASFAQSMGLGPDDVVYPGGSISHIGSLSTALAAFAAGSRVVLARGVDADVVLPLLREQKPSVMVMLPSALIALQHDHAASREDFSSLRLCITGGDKFPADQEREFTELTGLPVKETYGLTEAACCLFDPPAAVCKEGSIGVVCPGYVGSLRNEKDSEVAAGTDGNFWLRGAPVFLGYWNNTQATDAAFTKGWFDTGDVMQVDDDGFFWFRGRKKQIIVHDGSNIAPQEIEEAVMAHPAVQLAGVVGVHDAVHGENVWAFVSLREGAERPRVQDIIDCARKTVGYKAPEVVIILDEMPINATGKVDRLTLKKRAAERVSAHHVV